VKPADALFIGIVETNRVRTVSKYQSECLEN